MSEQLPLAISTPEEMRFADFLPTRSTRLAVNELKKFAKIRSESVIFLYGEVGTGKTHLLQATCHALMERGELPVYLSLAQPRLTPQALDRLEYQGTVCLDNLDAVIGNRQWEEALFHFYNRCQEQKTQCLLAARHAPGHLDCVLPDLKSRLSHGLALPLAPLTDAEKIYVLQQKSRLRGMELSMDAGSYLIRHICNDMKTLLSHLQTLDRVALIKQRKLTVPFIRSVLLLDEVSS